MGKPTGFMEIKREKPAERDPLTRLKDWKEYSAPFSEEASKRQGARCMDCGTPFCQIGADINGFTSGCPIYNLIPEWNDLVYRGRWKEALERLLKTNNFPEFTGRVCPAPCEGSCTLAISDPAVSIKNIERTIIDKGFENGWIQPRIPKKRTGKKVAIVGSGPAGLASADQLNQAGHSVTVFERSDRAGGLLTYGIPNMKLEKGIVERRVKLLTQEGIDFVTNTEIGVDITADELKEQFDAVILCTGAQKQRDLLIEGRNSKGVHYAMDYLTLATKSYLDSNFKDKKFIDAKGKDVIVIGGGDTGADCVATALRQKAKSVHQFGKHPKLPPARTNDNQWPEQPHVFTLEYAYEEAEAKFGRDPREYSIQTKKMVADKNGKLKELHTIQMEKVKNEHGKYEFRELPGTEKVWPAQLVFIAIGFEGTEQPLLKQFGVNSVNNKISAAYGDYQTNIDGVFAAGDARRGQSLIVWAINEGREVAREVDRYLMGSSVLP
ncbi:glutamate synthase small subunit [Bacillus inaquosorum]|uniref:Glutamate synthase small subunit n=1 Tax=Bacillus inaquosorum TaxID=483913 RepID=A0A9Q4I0A4_9BACI|nr:MULTISPECIES: glutamate synthase small subunit [Bacillus]TDO07522.1 glutamate synthase (NADPH) small subunit [Bacillus subtilis]MCE0739885.1 glutamate synthase small subunit [Bacillus sp. G16]MCY7787038.1 glutamate synthase small subunit [Bacillus inaquosorum]MCY7909634.1 glutamate synthase small subunit [Bacillus inaquosorum]MCY7939996.1 glutamate synthase small subunit [Bacillus inaquosorum]